MMLRYSFDLDKEAQAIEDAVSRCLRRATGQSTSCHSRVRLQRVSHR